jgi:hypothetical protein
MAEMLGAGHAQGARQPDQRAARVLGDQGQHRVLHGRRLKGLPACSKKMASVTIAACASW